MPQKDLFIEEPHPAAAQINVACRNCHHFADVPFYSIDGRKTVCSHERIGRRANQVPCPNFAVNMSIFRHLPATAMEHLVQFLAAMELDFNPGKSRAQAGRDLHSITELLLALRAMQNARRLGFELGGDYAVNNSEVAGVLVSLGKQHATVKNRDTGVAYTVEQAQITRL